MESIQVGRMPDPAGRRRRLGTGAEAVKGVGHLPGNASITRKREPHPDQGEHSSDDAQPRASGTAIASEKREDDQRHSESDGGDTQSNVRDDSHNRGGRSAVCVLAEPNCRARPRGPLNEK